MKILISLGVLVAAVFALLRFDIIEIETNGVNWNSVAKRVNWNS